MIKPTPNPPEVDSTSPYETLDSKKFHEAAERALDHYLNPPPPPQTAAQTQYPLPHRPRHRQRRTAGRRLRNPDFGQDHGQ